MYLPENTIYGNTDPPYLLCQHAEVITRGQQVLVYVLVDQIIGQFDGLCDVGGYVQSIHNNRARGIRLGELVPEHQ